MGLPQWKTLQVITTYYNSPVQIIGPLEAQVIGAITIGCYSNRTMERLKSFIGFRGLYNRCIVLKETKILWIWEKLSCDKS